MAYYPVLVNRSHLLPPDYIPDDLEEAGIPFCAPPGSEKRLLSLEYSSLKQFRQSLWLTDIFLSTCYIFYIGYVDLY